MCETRALVVGFGHDVILAVRAAHAHRLGADLQQVHLNRHSIRVVINRLIAVPVWIHYKTR